VSEYDDGWEEGFAAGLAEREDALARLKRLHQAINELIDFADDELLP
jgi:flagellar biosynthesis/type III secretory pathway protein FliH